MTEGGGTEGWREEGRKSLYDSKIACLLPAAHSFVGGRCGSWPWSLTFVQPVIGQEPDALEAAVNRQALHGIDQTGQKGGAIGWGRSADC